MVDSGALLKQCQLSASTISFLEISIRVSCVLTRFQACNYKVINCYDVFGLKMSTEKTQNIGVKLKKYFKKFLLHRHWSHTGIPNYSSVRQREVVQNCKI